MAPKNHDLNLMAIADKFSEYIDIVWKKIEEDNIEDIEKIGVKFRKCVTFFAAYIKYIPSYIDKALYLCRSILILIESKNLQWDLKYYGKLVIICCLNMLFGRSEDLTRESCNIMKELLRKIEQDSLDVIVRKYSYYLSLLMQRVLTVRTRLTQAMILEVICKLTKNAADARQDALKKQKFFARLNPTVAPLLLKSFKKIDDENMEKTSRGFLMTINMLLNPKSGIFTAEGCIYKIDNFENTEADTVHIDFNWREQSVSFTVETQIICAALKPTNIHYSTSKDPAYFELFFNSVQLQPIEPTEDEMDIILNVNNLMYKQDMNSALQEIDDVSRIQMTLLGNRENLTKFKIFYDRFKSKQFDGNLSNDKNESFLSVCTDVSFLDETFSIDNVNGSLNIPVKDNENGVVDPIQADFKQPQEPFTIFIDEEVNDIEVPPQTVETVRQEPFCDKENVSLQNFVEMKRKPSKVSEQPKLVVVQELEEEMEVTEKSILESHQPEINDNDDDDVVSKKKIDVIINKEKQPWWKEHLQTGGDRILKIPKPKYPIVRPISIKDIMRKEGEARKAKAQEKRQKVANNQPKKRGRPAKKVKEIVQKSRGAVRKENGINQPRKITFSESEDSDNDEDYKTAPKTSKRHRPSCAQFDTNYNCGDEESPLKQYRGVGHDVYEMVEEEAPPLPRSYKAYVQKKREKRPAPVIVDPKMINPQLTPEKIIKDYMNDYWMDSYNQEENFKVEIAVESESFMAENRKRWDLEVNKRAEENLRGKIQEKLKKKQIAEERRLKKIKEEEAREISRANAANTSQILKVDRQAATSTTSRKSKTPKNARDENVTSTGRKSTANKSIVKKEPTPRESPKRLSRRSKLKAKELLAAMSLDSDEGVEEDLDGLNVKEEKLSIEKTSEVKNDSQSLYLTASENFSASGAWGPDPKSVKKPTNKRKSDYDYFLSGLHQKQIKTDKTPLILQAESYQEEPLDLVIRKDQKMEKLLPNSNLNKRESGDDLKGPTHVKDNKIDEQPLELNLNPDTKCEKNPYFGANCKQNVKCVKMKFNVDVAINPIQDKFVTETRNQRTFKFTELTSSQISEYLTSNTHQLALVPLNSISPKL